MSKLGKLDLDGSFQNDKIVNLQLIIFMCIHCVLITLDVLTEWRMHERT
jgi:hypothetical protein